MAARSAAAATPGLTPKHGHQRIITITGPGSRGSGRCRDVATWDVARWRGYSTTLSDSMKWPSHPSGPGRILVLSDGQPSRESGRRGGTTTGVLGEGLLMRSRYSFPANDIVARRPTCARDEFPCGELTREMVSACGSPLAVAATSAVRVDPSGDRPPPSSESHHRVTPREASGCQS